MRRILVVEDDISIAELERDYLEANGYEVELAGNGNDGLRRATDETFDLVLIDVMLPGMDGFSVCRELRKTKDIPVIMVTARKDDIDKIRGLGLGADDYVEKPFSPSVLVARVGAHLSRYERLTSSGVHNEPERGAIIVGEFKILPASRRVYLGEREITLANKEFEILYFLASNPDMVFSRDTIFDRIWGMDSLGDASTVTVHINRIREKTESEDGVRRIETVWGAGYRFHVE